MTVPITGITPVYDLEYLEEGEPAFHIRAKWQRTVEQVEAALLSVGVPPPGLADLATLTARVDAMPKGRIASSVSATNGASGVSAETLIQSVTFTAIAGRRYRFTWDAAWVNDTSASTAAFRMRWAAGSPVTTAGTLAHARQARAPMLAEFIPINLESPDITGLPSGTVTVGVFAARIAGTGTLRFDASADNVRYLYVADVGAA
jgi:hypothetical protein